MATQVLADWVSSVSLEGLPQPVINASIRSFQNALGCIIGGSNHPTSQRALDSLRALSSTPTCTVIGQSGSTGDLKLDLQTTVLINGIASHVHDYDDTHLYTVIHPAGAIVVATLAYIEHLSSSTGQAISGKQFITAVVAGIETSLRLGNAVSPNHYDHGWHITGTVSPLGVAAAISSLIGLDTTQTANALGLAATQPVGLRVHFGTDTKSFHVGRAAQNGILAAQLASGGFTAATDALEGRRGWVEILGNSADELSSQIEGLLKCSQSDKSRVPNTSNAEEREFWEIEKNTFKPFPCGIVIHPIIDACIQLHNQYFSSSSYNSDTEHFNPSNIVQVSLRVHTLVLDLTGKKLPRNGLEAKFSVYHGAVIGLLFGAATPAQYDDNVVMQSDVVEFRSKVTAEVDDKVSSDEAYVTVVVHDKNGKEVKLEKHVEHAVGSFANPMSDEELSSKFLDQVGAVTGTDRAEDINKLAWNVLTLEDLRVLINLAS